MNTLTINNSFIKKNLTTENNTPIKLLQNDEVGNLMADGKFYLDIVDYLKAKNEENNEKKTGGRVSKNVEVNEKKNKTEDIGYKSVVDVQKIGKEILKEIVDGKIIMDLNIGNESRLMNFVSSYIHKNQYIFNNSEYDLLIRYIRENMFKTIKDHVINNHSLLTMSEYKNTTLNNLCDKTDEQKKIMTVQQSVSWSDLDDLSQYTGKIKLGTDYIDPIFFALGIHRLPGLEDLIIRSDYQTLMEQVINQEIDNKQMFLFLLRLMDPSLLPSRDMQYKGRTENELLRTSITVLLRDIFYTLRTGDFTNKSSCKLLELLNKIVMPTAKFQEENIIQAILATFSYKPSLITKAVNVNNFQFNFQPVVYETPKAVYTIEYPLADMYCFMENTIPKISQNSFNFLGYDKMNNKVIFTYSNSPTVIENEKENLLKNIYQIISTNKLEVDTNAILPTIAARQPGLKDVYKNVSQIQLLTTSGLYITIPRIESKYYNASTSNLFFRPTFKPKLNLSKIAIETSFVVNKITYELSSAVCYDVLEGEGGAFDSIIFGNGLNNVDIKNKIGRYAIVKSGKNWYKYNPQKINTNYGRKNKFEQVSYNRYLQFLKDNGNKNFDQDEFEKWREENRTNIIQDITDGKFYINDMIISEKDALEEISTRACILIYSESYDVYKTRIMQRC